jgi:hypothetical protein
VTATPIVSVVSTPLRILRTQDGPFCPALSTRHPLLSPHDDAFRVHAKTSVDAAVVNDKVPPRFKRWTKDGMPLLNLLQDLSMYYTNKE